MSEALRPGRTFGDVVDAMRKPLHTADGWEFRPSIHALNPMIALSGFPADTSRKMAGAEAYPPEVDHPMLSGDMELEPGMTFALEPNYAFGQHLAYLGGTVIVGEDEPIELNPYTARILRAAGTPSCSVY
ncbi:M24 family metallopeptidase [Saccharopolyspora shandongensis]|uniref:M24 family metallopeptidase n=1 Tax=Saccharopolyspora shandongensis TaxID=418495 RepID=UPI003445CDD4